MDQTLDDNVFQLGIIEIVFQMLDIFTNIITGVLLPAIMTPIFNAFFSLFQAPA